MNTFSLVFSVLCVCVGIEALNLGDVDCGIQRIIGGRIVNGSSAYHGEFPWIVSVRRWKEHYCGGVLITARHILSAAHCYDEAPRKYRAYVGIHSTHASKQNSMEISNIIKHPGFKAPFFKDDIAIIQLKSSVCWNSYIQPICLPDNDRDTLVGKDTIVAGWGWLKEAIEGGYPSKDLQKVTLPVVDFNECNSWYLKAGFDVNINSTQMCAGFQKGQQDSCQGDSGSPLMYHEFPDGIFHAVGVVSAGIGCARENLPGLYTRVSSYLPWIVKTVKKNRRKKLRRC